MRASSTGSGTSIADDSDSDSMSRVQSIVTRHIRILSVAPVTWGRFQEISSYIGLAKIAIFPVKYVILVY